MKIDKLLIAKAIFLILLISSFGASLYAAIFVAPNIFTFEYLDRYKAGILMTKNFIALSYFINMALIATFLFELYRFKLFQRDRVIMISALLVLMSGALFNFYYLPDIIQYTKMGEDALNSTTFEHIHKGSVIDLSIYLVSSFLLAFSELIKRG